MTNLAHAPGWYPDPNDASQQRWWDGSQWTSHTQPAAGGVQQAGGMQHSGGRMHAAGSFGAGGATGTQFGAASAGFGGHAVQQQPRTAGLAIAAFVLAFFVAPLGFILGIVSLGKIKKAPLHAPLKGKGLGIAAIIISSGIMLLSVLFIALMAAGWSEFSEGFNEGVAGAVQEDVTALSTSMEQCAVANLDGSYTGCDAPLKHPDHAQQLDAGCATMTGACIELLDGGQGYKVTVVGAEIGGDSPKFSITAAGDGSIEKTCEPASAAGCNGGTW